MRPTIRGPSKHISLRRDPPQDQEHGESGHDGNVRNVEDASPKRTYTNVHEVDDPTVSNTVDQVGRPTGDHEAQSDERAGIRAELEGHRTQRREHQPRSD